MRVDLPDDEARDGFTCSLDFADGGQVSVREVARLMGISRANAERIERSAIGKAQRSARRLGLSKAVFGGFAVNRQGEHIVDDGDTRAARSDNLKTHVCISCDGTFQTPDRNEVQRLFCTRCRVAR